jgi:hypothetical protein
MTDLTSLIASLARTLKGEALHVATRTTLAGYMLGEMKAKKADVLKLVKAQLPEARKLYEKVKRKKKAVSTDGLPAPLGSLTDMFSEEIRALTDQLQAGTITASEWEIEFEYALVRYQLAGAMAGSGSPDLSDPMITKVSDFITEQFGFLGDFTVEIAKSEGEWQAGWNSRAESYAGSIKQPYWTGETKMLPLPAMPGDLSSDCGQNCYCSWDVQTIDEATGSYDCYWRYGDDVDHCPQCRIREREWKPLRIRGGMVQ